MKNIRRSIQALLLLCLLAGCETFLDEKPDKAMVVPATLPDLQALLDNYPVLNENDPGAGEVSADDYYLTDADWESLYQEEDRRMYIWAEDRLFAEQSNDWFFAYRPVYTANTVLETLPLVPRTAANTAAWDNVKGQALFARGRSFLQIALLWSPSYDPATASTDLGIPLRRGTDFNAPSTRSSVQQTYDQILADLTEATALLPRTQVHPVRPSKPAAYALLARTHLALGNYAQVAAYADSALSLHPQLLDFNTLDTTAAYPVPPFNKEILFRSIMPTPSALNPSRAKITPSLYAAYAPQDLRRTVFFRDNGDGTYSFRGSYEGSLNLFSGVATDEVYLMRAEAYARLGQVDKALADLNTLLATRWKAGTFEPYSATGKEEALNLVLQERRKELLMRGLRWLDLKRLNSEGAGITLTRTVNGQTYTLPPRDPRYALPLPEEIIELSGMPQNPR
ncbi:RagB/SusD family nutrient uptake outer membrane protein [Pontibacter actiniarum]|uniref:RagB/SusD family nutrient uptake outer membrane protein n=1 Tax=Pontibacter actiniarum TaxID=323450 RepID=A0A1X9YSG1_9BACT|nr:RagB/SusD family nutrient uptake outer membrane protein [Pontibacter actiniarum]ARS35802.1 RagB/SusD family nutrient uptake outer membrane protein [Pontibacter actiniarum]